MTRPKKVFVVPYFLFSGILDQRIKDLVERAALEYSWIAFEKNKSTQEELSRQISQRDDFLSIVCHDLRNPLGVISACVDYIIDDEENNEQL